MVLVHKTELVVLVQSTESVLKPLILFCELKPLILFCDWHGLIKESPPVEPEPSRRLNLLFTVEGSGIQGKGWGEKWQQTRVMFCIFIRLFVTYECLYKVLFL